MRLTRVGNVSGRINDDKGQPASGVPLQLVKVTYNSEGQRIFQTAGGARTNDRGEYRIYWITPGRYYLAAGTPPGPSTGFGRGNVSPNETLSPYVFAYYPGATDLSRAIPIDVRPGSEQPVDFQVTRQQLYSIRGRIVDAATNQSTGPIAIALAYRTMTGVPGVLQFAQVYDPATGLFEIPNVVPGAYVILGNTGTGTVRTPVEVVNADIANLTLVDVVTDDRLQPLPGAQAVLVPDRNRDRTELFKPATTDPSGRFAMGGVAPGDYKLFAWEGLENFGYFDPELLKQSELSGKPVHIDESARIIVETKIIR